MPFLRQFYDNLKVLCNEFFLGRAKTAAVTDSASNPIEAVFEQRGAKSYVDRANVMDELVDTRVSASGAFSAPTVASRIEQSAAAVASGQASHLLLGSRLSDSQALVDRINSMSAGATRTPVPAVNVVANDALAQEYIECVRQEVQLRVALGKAVSATKPAIERNLRACQARKTLISGQLKALRSQQSSGKGADGALAAALN